MAWDSIVNQQYGVDKIGDAIFALIHEFLQTLGWSVVMSGDGIAAFSAVGSVITSGNTPFPIVGSIGNWDAWFVLESPSGVQLLIQRAPIGSWPYAWLTAVSHAGLFVGGNATTRPTAADEHGLPADPVAVSANSFGDDAGTNSYYHMIAADVAVNGEWPFTFQKTNVATGASMGYLFSWVVHDEDAGDTAPLIWGCYGESLGQSSWLNTGRRAMTLYDPAGAATWETAYSGFAYINAGIEIPGATLPPPDGITRTRRMGWWVMQGASYVWKGRGDTIFSPDNSDLTPWNNLWLDQHSIPYLAIDGLANDGLLLPGWPDMVTCPLPDLGAGITTHDVIVIDAAANPDIIPPTIAVVSPTVGSTIRAGEPFVVDVTDAGGFALVVLTAEIPAGGAHEVVWLKGVFSDAYSLASTITAVADGYRFSILRRGGWSASPTFHVECVDNSGNAGL